MKVLLLNKHPVQYLAPLFRRYAMSPDVDLTVAYCVLPDTGGRMDERFGLKTDWGLDLLAGYDYVCVGRSETNKRSDRPSGIWRTIKRGDFDLVLSYGYDFPTAWLSLLAAKRFGAKWGFVGDNHSLESPSGRRVPAKRLLLRALGASVDVVVAQSVRSAEFYRRFAPSKVRLVGHAIDDERFRLQASTRSIDRPFNRTVFLFVGKLVKNKRVADLIDACALVPPSEVWIVGSGPEETELRSRAKSLGVAARFFGFVSQVDLPAFYAACDAVVLPSAFETFGLCVSEAAAVGRPAVVSSACGVRDSLVVEGVSGLVFKAGDVDSLAASLRELTDPAVRSALAKGMAAEQSRWSKDCNVQAFLGMCRDLHADATTR